MGGLRVLVLNCPQLPTIVIICDANSLYERAQKATNVHNCRQLRTSCREWPEAPIREPPFGLSSCNGSAKRKTLALLVGFPCFFVPSKQGLEGTTKDHVKDDKVNKTLILLLNLEVSPWKR